MPKIGSFQLEGHVLKPKTAFCFDIIRTFWELTYKDMPYNSNKYGILLKALLLNNNDTLLAIFKQYNLILLILILLFFLTAYRV